jgi:hypothetical protein
MERNGTTLPLISASDTLQGQILRYDPKTGHDPDISCRQGTYTQRKGINTTSETRKY